MDRYFGAATALLLAGALTACGSTPPPPAPEDALPPGTAEVSINGTDIGRTGAVSCTTLGPVTMITTGSDDSGTVLSVDNRDGLTAQYAKISDLGGFTGSYWEGLGPDPSAEIQAIGNTIVMTGSAIGYNTDNPSFRANGDFSIRVAC